MAQSGIYKIESSMKPERVYIGSAVNVMKRWQLHLWDLKNNKHHSIKLQRHYNKYGKNDLVFSILHECEVPDLLQAEQVFLNVFEPYFNVCGVAGSCLGKRHSEEAKRKMSGAKKGKYKGENNPMFGRTGEKCPMFGRTGKKHPMHERTGEKNSSYDYTLHTFVHSEYGIEKCTQYELRRKYNLSQRNLSGVIKGKRKSCGGWRVEGVEAYSAPKGKKHYAYNHNIYTFIHSEHGIENSTCYDLCVKYNLKSGHLGAVVRRERNSCKGWRINNLNN